MRAEIIAIGTELLLGHIVNTNTSFLGQKLAGLGIDVYFHHTVGDNPERLTAAIKQALGRSDIVITTGGLGPTVDDITASVVSNIAKKAPIKRIRNIVGSAPGLIISFNHRAIRSSSCKTIICLPGPPREMEPMFTNDVVPFLKKRFGCTQLLKSRVIKLTGLAESKVDRRVKDLLALKPPVTVGIYAKLGEVDLKIMAKAADGRSAERSMRGIEKKIRSRLGKYIFGYDDDTLEGVVGSLLRKKKLTIAVTESCTGGLLASRLTNVSGSSKYFTMGLAAYSNEVKVNILCVDPAVLSAYGAVSATVARQMAVGIRLLAGTDIGIAITGIAGPTGATKTKPVGLVYIAIVVRNKLIVQEMRFKGNREEIKFQASQSALELVRKNIR